MNTKHLLSAALGLAVLGSPLRADNLVISNESDGTWTVSTHRVVRPFKAHKWTFGGHGCGAAFQTFQFDRENKLDLALKPSETLEFQYDAGFGEDSAPQGLQLRDGQGTRLTPGAATDTFDLFLVAQPNVTTRRDPAEVTFIECSNPMDAYRAGLMRPNRRTFRILQTTCLALSPRVEAAIRAQAPAATAAVATTAAAAAN